MDGTIGRTIVVGDVHGCREELEGLLERTAFAQGVDRLVFVGDLVARGPDSRGVLALVRKVGARVVRGNHEQRLLSGRHEMERLGPDHERVARSLSDADWRALEATPLWIDLEEHGLRVVHAGVVPNVDVARTPPQALLTMRTLDASGRWSNERDRGRLWGDRYKGPPHVVFGHNALGEPQLHKWATGIDTGCVYGGRLTALVLDAGEPMPRGKKVRPRLTSVRARHEYHSKRGSARRS